MNRSLNALSLALATCLLTGNPRAADVELASSEQKRAAQKMFEAADGLYESGHFEEAVQAFRASYELVASPNSRLMVARALRELRRPDEAFVEYQATIRDAESSGGRYPETLNAANAESEALGRQLAFLIVDAAPEASEVALRVNGKPVKFTPGERIPVMAPKVEVEFRYTNGKTRVESLELKQSETRRLVASAQPILLPRTNLPTKEVVSAAAPHPEPRSNGLRSGAYVAGGIGAAGLLAFGVFAAIDRSTYLDLQAKCASNICPLANGSDIDAGRRYQLAANIGAGVAVAGLATAVTLYVISSSSSSQERSVSLGVDPGKLVVSGHF